MTTFVALYLALSGAGLTLWAYFEDAQRRPFTAHVLRSFAFGSFCASMVVVGILLGGVR